MATKTNSLNRKNIKRDGTRVSYVDASKKHWLIYDFMWDDDPPWTTYTELLRNARGFAKHLRERWVETDFLTQWNSGREPLKLVMTKGWLTVAQRLELKANRLPITCEGYKRQESYYERRRKRLGRRYRHGRLNEERGRYRG